MLSQNNFRLIVSLFSLVLIIGTVGMVVIQPAYAEGASTTESEGLPGHRVGGGTRVGSF